MAGTVRKTAEKRVPLPTAPTVEAWRAMTPGERERLLVAINEALRAAKVEQVDAMAEHIAREALMAVLDVRGLPCSEQARARIDACADPSILQGWMLRAKTAASIEEILAEPSDGSTE